MSPQLETMTETTQAPARRPKVTTRNKLTEEEIILFFEHLRSGASVEVAARELGRAASTFYNRAKRDKAFRERLDDAQSRHTLRWDDVWALVAMGQSVASACRQCGISESVYRAKRREPDFMRKVIQAQAALLSDKKAKALQGMMDNKDWHGVMKWFKLFMPHLLPSDAT